MITLTFKIKKGLRVPEKRQDGLGVARRLEDLGAQVLAQPARWFFKVRGLN